MFLSVPSNSQRILVAASRQNEHPRYHGISLVNCDCRLRSVIYENKNDDIASPAKPHPRLSVLPVKPVSRV